MRFIPASCIFLISLVSTPAFAYIGPGLGAGTVGVILGVIGSVFLALFAIFWYPVKRLLKRVKKPPQEPVDQEARATQTESPESEQ